MHPPSRPRPAPDAARLAGAGCLGCLGLLVALAACGAVLTAVGPRPAPTPAGRGRPVVRGSRSGAFCSPRGAVGRHRGRLYTGKGPGRPRWRR